jgi:hypothetical protein
MAALFRLSKSQSIPIALNSLKCLELGTRCSYLPDGGSCLSCLVGGIPCVPSRLQRANAPESAATMTYENEFSESSYFADEGDPFRAPESSNFAFQENAFRAPPFSPESFDSFEHFYPGVGSTRDDLVSSDPWATVHKSSGIPTSPANIPFAHAVPYCLTAFWEYYNKISGVAHRPSFQVALAGPPTLPESPKSLHSQFRRIYDNQIPVALFFSMLTVGAFTVENHWWVW